MWSLPFWLEKKIKKSFGYIKNSIIFVVQLNNNNMAKMKYQILSPDGFSLERDVIGYTSRKKAIEAFNQWKRGYEAQGYYSSTKYGRIPLEDLEDYCQFIER